MVEPFSDEWFEAASKHLADARCAGSDLSLKVKVEKSPSGTVTFRAAVEDGVPVLEGPLRQVDADLAVTVRYEHLQRIAGSEVSVAVAYMQGDVKIEGDPLPVLDLVRRADEDGWPTIVAGLLELR